MCPSYRATRNEKDVTRGRANTLRLAISGQLGPDALSSDEMMDTLKLCVSCKACRHECPTGVDMAKMKIEVLAARVTKHGLSLRDRLVGYLPRYAGTAARLAPLANARNHSPLLRNLLGEVRRHRCPARFAAMAARCVQSRCARRSARSTAARSCCSPIPSIAVMSGKTLTPRCTCWSKPDTASTFPKRPPIAARALCCRRTFLSAGLVDHAERARARLVEDLRAVRRAWCPDRRARTELPADAARRVAVAALRRHAQRASARRLCCSRNSWYYEAEAGRLQLPLGPGRRQGAGARPLPSGNPVRRIQAGRAGAAACSRS